MIHFSGEKKVTGKVVLGEVVETIASLGHGVGAVANAIGQALTRAARRALET